MQGRHGPPSEFQTLVPLTPVARILIILSVSIWLIGSVILEQYIFDDQKLTLYLGLVPYEVIHKFFFWQPLTYMFIHSPNPMHIIFNMLLLWWLGGDLELRWGSKFFLVFYLICGVGSALLYCVGLGAYSMVTGKAGALLIPVVGASGAVFGLMVAFAHYFGDRVVYFMMLFPMKARMFVLLLGLIEIVIVLNNGVGGGGAANLAHIGGLVTGYVFLKLMPYFKGPKGGAKGQEKKRRSSNLKLVVNNDLEKPRYWN